MPVLNNQHILQQLAQHECCDATHITGNFPLILARAQGSRLWDIEGREYIDLCAGFGSLPLGHNSEAWQQACSPNDSINTGMGDIYASQAKVALLAALHKVMPAYLTRAVLSLVGQSGSRVGYQNRSALPQRPSVVVLSPCTTAIMVLTAAHYP